MEKKLLYINRKDLEKKRKVQACAVLSRVRLLSPEEEELLMLPGDAELMKLSGFSNAELSEFLKQLRAAGVTVALKCVETESNKDWTLIQLYQELMEEHEYMKGQRERGVKSETDEKR